MHEWVSVYTQTQADRRTEKQTDKQTDLRKEDDNASEKVGKDNESHKFNRAPHRLQKATHDQEYERHTQR